MFSALGSFGTDSGEGKNVEMEGMFTILEIVVAVEDELWLSTNEFMEALYCTKNFVVG